jgi:hypothetical protein
VQALPLLLLLKHALFGDAVVSAVVICCYTQASSTNKGRTIAKAPDARDQVFLKHVFGVEPVLHSYSLTLCCARLRKPPYSVLC